jgi:hypothetical protein
MDFFSAVRMSEHYTSNVPTPATAAERSEACTIFTHSEAGFVGSYPLRAWTFGVFVHMHVFLCFSTGRGLATS